VNYVLFCLALVTLAWVLTSAGLIYSAVRLTPENDKPVHASGEGGESRG
jgi:hypothetical protein